MNKWILAKLNEFGAPPDLAGGLAEWVEALLLAGLACVAYVVAQRVLVRVVHGIAVRTRSHWDDKFVERHVFRRICHVVPALVVHVLAPTVFSTEAFVLWARRGAGIYALVTILSAAILALTVANEIYDELKIARRFPIRVYVQALKILLIAGAVILIVAILIGESPLLLLSGLGAMTAVILLISKDSIQGLLAGIQLVANDMIRPGDWIEAPQFGADGDVVEISLQTVKVRNWDNTLMMVPAYSLVSQSFKNWRGMAESAGRRIKRSILVDVSSVRFCDQQMIDRFKQIERVREYVEATSSNIAEHNRDRHIDESVEVNGRRMTNLGVFRNYMVSYLRDHPMINREMTLMVRQLQSTEHGIPLEVYAFSADKNWVPYEGIQSDVFDHLFAAMKEFDLRAFQRPSGYDNQTFARFLRN